MDELNVGTLYSVMLIASCALSIYSVFRNQSKDTQRDGIDEGTMQTDLNYIKQSLDKIELSVTNLDTKMERKYADIEKEFRDLLVANTKLEQSYKILHKRVDNLCDTMQKNNLAINNSIE